jgi:hypothetical protein
VDASVVVHRLHDVGYEVDLERDIQALAASAPERKAPTRTEAQAIRIANPPVTLALPSERVTLGGLELEARVSAQVFEFAVVSLRLQLALPRDLTWEALADFSRRVDLLSEARPVLDRALAHLMEHLAPAVVRPELAPVAEDYVVFRVDAMRGPGGAPAPPGCLRDEDLVPILLGEEKPLSEDARRELLPRRFSYYQDDLAILTWNGALVIEPAREDADVEYVLEFANAQLLELRVYDELLDRELPKLYTRIASLRARPRLLFARRLAPLLTHLQTLVAETAEFVERVENALKMTDDVYLARIYSAALGVFRSRSLARRHRPQARDPARHLLDALRGVARRADRGTGAGDRDPDRGRDRARPAPPLTNEVAELPRARADGPGRGGPPGAARRVAVVGAGAAGLSAALAAAQAGARVTLLNAHPRLGLKILMSGGTRCNVTHREVTERDFQGGSRPFVRRVLSAFPAERARAWLESLGVALKLEGTGKVFPVTDDARTVLGALLGAVERAGVMVESGARVVRLERAGSTPHQAAPGVSGYRLGIETVRSSGAFDRGVSRPGETSWPLPAIQPDRWLEADAVVIATGGLSFPRTGSDGTGYALVTALGHTLEPPVPALTPLASEDPLCRAAQGITLEVELTLWIGDRRAVATRGSMVIAHFGFSGPAALDLSRHWHRAEGKQRRVTASFAPGETAESLLGAWLDAAARAPRRTLRRHLARCVPERLAERLAGEAGVAPEALVSQVDREHRTALLERVRARDLGVTGTLGYEKAEVTAGGVRLAEVNAATLESRVAPALFLCGEILDVEGRLGGFNFQWAWSSGTVAGRSAARLPGTWGGRETGSESGSGLDECHRRRREGPCTHGRSAWQPVPGACRPLRDSGAKPPRMRAGAGG